MATPNQSSTNGRWTLVTRRRRPPHFLPSLQSPPKNTTPLNLRPTYAQVVQSGPQRAPSNLLMPSSDKQPRTVSAPQSPTKLRYPPNPHFKEWWGRCFRCEKKGHVVADCKLPKMPLQAEKIINLAENSDPNWGDLSTQEGPANRYQHRDPARPRAEPTFEEFLGQPEPMEKPYMPTIRPTKVVCYINRDEQYFQLSQKLSTAIVIQPPANLKENFSLDQAAEIIASSSKVTTAQIQIGRLTRDRFLVVLPGGSNREEIVKAIPRKVWDEGVIL